MRYIIQHADVADKDKPVQMTTYSAVEAENHLKAIALFNEKHPDRVALKIKECSDSDFALFGMGAMTDEEIAEHKRRLQEVYARSKDEHKKAAAEVSAYSLEEFALEQEYNERRASETTQNLDGIHIGDIFYTSWGYDQTNIDFYQVVALRGKHTVVVRQNNSKSVMCSDYTGYTRPIRNEYDERKKEIVCRTSVGEYYGEKYPRFCVNKSLAVPVTFGRLYSNSSGA